jgi:Flp pilus assembly protein TadG
VFLVPVTFLAEKPPLMRKQWPLTLKARIRNFLADWSGVAAVEFAYLAPLLMLMTFGTFEMARALIVQKRFQRAASMVADLVARQDQTDPLGATASAARSTLSGIMISAQHVMQPYSSTPLTLNIYQLWASPTDATQTKIEWAYQYPTNASTGCGNLKSMPASGMLATNGRAIVVEATYQYTPLLTNIIPGLVHQTTWADKMALLPRNGPTVYFIPSLNNSKTWTSPDLSPCQ